MEHKRVLDGETRNFHKVTRIKAERYSDRLKAEKKPLQYMIASFPKEKHGEHGKIRKIKEIL